MVLAKTETETETSVPSHEVLSQTQKQHD